MAKLESNYDQKEAGELAKILTEKEKQYFAAKMDLAQGKTKDVHASRKIRREIAKIKTVIQSRKLAV
jgi:ribosomal protein L29